jgi:hypothetical protein
MIKKLMCVFAVVLSVSATAGVALVFSVDAAQARCCGGKP